MIIKKSPDLWGLKILINMDIFFFFFILFFFKKPRFVGFGNFDKINMHIFIFLKPRFLGFENFDKYAHFFIFFFFFFFFSFFFFICFSFFFHCFFLHFFNYLYIKRIPWDAPSCLPCTSTVVAIMSLMNSCIKYEGIEHLREVAILGLVVKN